MAPNVHPSVAAATCLLSGWCYNGGILNLKSYIQKHKKSGNETKIGGGYL